MTRTDLDQGRTRRVGLLFVGQVGAPRTEAFFNEVIVGLEIALFRRASSLIVRMVEDRTEEIEVYRHWHATRAVDAVVVKDLLIGDQRIEQLRRLPLPFVALCDTTQTGPFPAVRFDNGRAMSAALRHLTQLGHRQIARVSGPPDLAHTSIRSDTFEREARAAGVTYRIVAGDYSQGSGDQQTRALLADAPRPTAVIYDNDLMALGGLAATEALGLAVPADLALLAWDDSVDCQLASPPLSALSHDVQRIGEQVGELLLANLDGRADPGGRTGDEAGADAGSLVASQPMIVDRGSTVATSAIVRAATLTTRP